MVDVSVVFHLGGLCQAARPRKRSLVGLRKSRSWSCSWSVLVVVLVRSCVIILLTIRACSAVRTGAAAKAAWWLVMARSRSLVDRPIDCENIASRLSGMHLVMTNLVCSLKVRSCCCRGVPVRRVTASVGLCWCWCAVKAARSSIQVHCIPVSISGAHWSEVMKSLMAISCFLSPCIWCRPGGSGRQGMV